jgi:hypothetical protein
LKLDPHGTIAAERTRRFNSGARQSLLLAPLAKADQFWDGSTHRLTRKLPSQHTDLLRDLVRPEGESLKEIFSTLAEWNDVLNRSAPDIFPASQPKTPQP